MYITVDVDPDEILSSLSNKDLIGEIEHRDLFYMIESTDGLYSESMDRLYCLLSLGKNDEAIELMREFVQDYTGKVLP